MAIKQVSYPPFIVFFDTIAVFLFLLVMNQNKTINIDIPQDVLFEGAEVFYEKANHFFNVNTGVEYNGKNLAFLVNCGKQLECVQARIKHGQNVYILLPENTFSDISKLTMIAFETESCSSVRYVVNKSGSLNYKETQKNNPCLNKIPGFKARAEGS